MDEACRLATAFAITQAKPKHGTNRHTTLGHLIYLFQTASKMREQIVHSFASDDVACFPRVVEIDLAATQAKTKARPLDT